MSGEDQWSDVRREVCRGVVHALSGVRLKHVLSEFRTLCRVSCMEFCWLCCFQSQYIVKDIMLWHYSLNGRVKKQVGFADQVAHGKVRSCNVASKWAKAETKYYLHTCPSTWVSSSCLSRYSAPSTYSSLTFKSFEPKNLNILAHKYWQDI